MYLKISPLDIREFERETNVSFFSLLSPTLENGITLYSIVKRCKWNRAVKEFDTLLQSTSLEDWYRSLASALIEDGYLMNPDDATVDDDIVDAPSAHEVYWSKIWERNYWKLVKLGISWTDYWEWNPTVLRNVSEQLSEKVQEDANFMLDLIHALGGYVRIAFHDLNGYPNESMSTANKKDVSMTLEDQAVNMRALKDRFMKNKS
jgi:hypothetical protein